MLLDAVVTAGGIPEPGEPLYPYTQGISKSLLDVAGKPMIQWVLDALGEAATINNVIVVGLTRESGVTCRKPLHFIPNQGKMLDNFRAGVAKAREINPEVVFTVFAASDIPTITSKMVDWVVNTSMETDDDIYYNVITQPVMEARFPGSNRTYTHLKDMDVCGGDLNVVRASVAADESDIWEKISNARKSPLKQAALIGYDTLILLLLKQLTIDKVINKVARQLKVNGRGIVCPYAEIGMDVDKPHQLEIVRSDLAG
ncbi:MAG TPA: NTP transferase domain-containing protein [Anaerolineales bacterium]|nr:NTP transferase domain-containing protein [Anaerolineales bacterium]